MVPLPPWLSVIIPTYNEECTLAATLAAVAALSGEPEVIVVDGGSQDATVRVAQERGVRVLAARRGRGSQQHAGACAAQGAVLWFLHADTVPPAEGAEWLRSALACRRVVGGNFRLCFAGPSWAAHFMTWLYPHLGRFGLCYGDSAVFVRREDYWRAGGFRPLPLFEDLDLVCRLRARGRFLRLPAAATTSSRRFEGRSFALTFLRWTILQLLYWLGFSPWTLARSYAPVRSQPLPRSGTIPA